MKNWKKQVKTMCGVLALWALLLTSLTVQKVEAASKAPSCVKSQTVYCYGMEKLFGGQKGHYTILDVPSSYIYIKNLSSGAVISNIKCSNSKVEVKSMLNGSYQSMKALHLEFKQSAMMKGKYLKNGEKAKITFRVKQNGKTYKLACNVTFRTKKSPVKSFKLGKKEYASAFSGYAQKTIKFPTSNFKVTVQRAAGFAIDEIDVFYKNGSLKKVKSGAVVSGKDIDCILVTYHVTKKPANYSAPTKWGGMVPSPLHEMVQIFKNPMG